MNSRERVQAAIARQPVDRVPLGFYAVDHDTVARVLGRPTYVRNKVATQIALWEGRRDEVAAGLKEDVVEFYRRIDCADLLLPKEAQLLPPRDYEPECPRALGDNRWEDRHGRIYQAVWSVNEIQCVYDPHPAAARQFRVEDFAGDVQVKPPDPSVFEVFDHVQAALGAERYVASPTGGVTALTLLGGTEEGLVRCIQAPEVVLAASTRSTAVQNQLDPYYVRSGAPGVLMEQDLAGSNGPLVSPAMFRQLALPFLMERIAHVRNWAPQVIFHNCGNNMPLMSMFADAGVDCYQSLQTTAGMEVGRLKAMFGARLCFWGGVPVEMLIEGTPEQVRQAVRQAMQVGAPGGGFILGPSHSIAFGTRYDNFLAMLDEFVRWRDRV